MARYLICLLLILGTAHNGFSQNFRKNQELFLEAEYFLLFGDYADALPYYLQLESEFPDNSNIAHRIGLCYLNIPGQKDKSIQYLEKAARNSAAVYREGSLKQETAPYSAWFDLGNAYRINYQFDKAKEAFKRYSETLLKEDTENVLFIEHQISVCDNAKQLIGKPVEYTIENLGELFNDAYSNFQPLLSADGNTMVFMSSLKFYDAIFFARKNRERWSPPINITPDLQSDGDLLVSSLSDGGNTMYLSKLSDNTSDIFVSHYQGNSWSIAEKIDNRINSKYWDTHAFVTDDGSLMIFASDRPGGLGGLDLYVRRRLENGQWGEPENMRPDINTPFNEDRPFLTAEGNRLFFCSQGHFNMGGFDLFRSDQLENGHWAKPVNLGYPVNTPDDDTYFYPVGRGKSGYISVFREGEGFGKEDIYYITFK